MNLEGLINNQLMMFTIIAVGVVLRRKGMILEEGKILLTDLNIDLFLPCSILASFMKQVDSQMLWIGFEALLVSAALGIVCMIANTFCYRWVPKAQRAVLQFGTLCSNTAVLGNSVAEGLYGSLGQVYASFYCIPTRVFMWSAGVSYFSEQSSRADLLKKVLTNHCIIAVALGSFAMVTGIRPPEFLLQTITRLGNCSTGVAMLFIGVVLADAGLKNMVTKITVIYSGIRLIGIPALVLAGCLLTGIDPMAASVCVVLSAMPAGSTGVVLAARYQGDEAFATQCVMLTTVLSLALLPMWCALVNYIY